MYFWAAKLNPTVTIIECPASSTRDGRLVVAARVIHYVPDLAQLLRLLRTPLNEEQCLQKGSCVVGPAVRSSWLAIALSNRDFS